MSASVRDKSRASDSVRTATTKPLKLIARMHAIAAKWFATLASAISGVSDLCGWDAFSEWANTPTGVLTGAVGVATAFCVCGLDRCFKRDARRAYSARRDMDDIDLPSRAHALLRDIPLVPPANSFDASANVSVFPIAASTQRPATAAAASAAHQQNRQTAGGRAHDIESNQTRAH
jgi:hypothetical protein